MRRDAVKLRWHLRETASWTLRLSGVETITGPLSAHRAFRREMRWRDEPFSRVLEAVNARRGDLVSEPTDEPLFILSAGWRSGSTLLQRLISSSSTYLLWGEPYAKSDIVMRLADSLRPISPRWPPDGYMANHASRGDLTDEWVANLYPSIEALVQSHRAFFRTLFGGNLTDGERPRWGFKEVRLSGDHALYLRFLFPKAKFIFLVRNPLDSYASYKVWRSWYKTWPDQQVRTPGAFARMWRDLTESFCSKCSSVDGLLLRYEDLTPGGSALPKLDAYLDARVNRNVLDMRIRGSSLNPPRLSFLDRISIRHNLKGAQHQFGYQL